MTGQEKPSRAVCLALLAILFLAGLGLRTAGLSMDLDEDKIYHPDTGKQIAATERFLDGRYYQKFGHPDYDGYPYFNSHLAEWICRPAS